MNQPSSSLSDFKSSSALTSILNWYRAAELTTESTDRFKKNITRRTFNIWGNQDPVMAPVIIPLQEEFIKAVYQEVELDVGHSLVQREKGSVLELL